MSMCPCGPVAGLSVSPGQVGQVDPRRLEGRPGFRQIIGKEAVLGAANMRLGWRGQLDLAVPGGPQQRRPAGPETGVLGSFKLWPVTIEYMLAEREPDASGEHRVFLTRPRRKRANHEPLVRCRVVDSIMKKSDAVADAFWSVQKTGINSRRSFSTLRNTGASMIERIDPTATEQYLSHAVNGMKKHYVQRDWGRLDAALDEMWGQLKGILKPEGGS